MGCVKSSLEVIFEALLYVALRAVTLLVPLPWVYYLVGFLYKYFGYEDYWAFWLTNTSMGKWFVYLIGITLSIGNIVVFGIAVVIVYAVIRSVFIESVHKKSNIFLKVWRWVGIGLITPMIVGFACYQVLWKLHSEIFVFGTNGVTPVLILFLLATTIFIWMLFSVIKNDLNDVD